MLAVQLRSNGRAMRFARPRPKRHEPIATPMRIVPRAEVSVLTPSDSRVCESRIQRIQKTDAISVSLATLPDSCQQQTRCSEVEIGEQISEVTRWETPPHTGRWLSDGVPEVILNSPETMGQLSDRVLHLPKL